MGSQEDWDLRRETSLTSSRTRSKAAYEVLRGRGEQEGWEKQRAKEMKDHWKHGK